MIGDLVVFGHYEEHCLMRNAATTKCTGVVIQLLIQSA